MEGSENNPVMFELLTELPWRSQRFNVDGWLQGYLKARYGKVDPKVDKAWRLLANSVYACPASSVQQGTHESVFCARPSMHVYQVSSWSEMKDYYQPMEVIKAAQLMTEVADSYKGVRNYEYDLLDIVRQAVRKKDVWFTLCCRLPIKRRISSFLRLRHVAFCILSCSKIDCFPPTRSFL